MRSNSDTAGQGKPSFIEEARRRQIVETAIRTIATRGYSQASLAEMIDDEPELSEQEMNILRDRVRFIEDLIRSPREDIRGPAIGKIRELLPTHHLYPTSADASTSVAVADVVRVQMTAHDVRSDERVLDLGCGTGYQALEALSHGAASAVCIDSKPEALIETLLNAEEQGVLDRITVDLVDIRRLSEWNPPHAFDRIIFNSSIPIYFSQLGLLGTEAIEQFQRSFDNNRLDIGGRVRDGFIGAVQQLLAEQSRGLHDRGQDRVTCRPFGWDTGGVQAVAVDCGEQGGPDTIENKAAVFDLRAAGK